MHASAAEHCPSHAGSGRLTGDVPVELARGWLARAHTRPFLPPPPPQDEAGAPHRGAAVTLSYHGALPSSTELYLRCDAAAQQLGLCLDSFLGGQL